VVELSEDPDFFASKHDPGKMAATGTPTTHHDTATTDFVASKRSHISKATM
jgi:hypothetical protein